MNQIEEWHVLLKKAEPFLQKCHEEEIRRPPEFNIFFALGTAYREVSTHSRLLAHFLDPGGGHSQGAMFLRTFLDRVQSLACQQDKRLRLPAGGDGAGWTVRSEVPAPSFGQLDIVLTGPGLVLALENKIYARDGRNQLARYWRFVCHQASWTSSAPVLVYLTPDGRSPTQQSIQEAQQPTQESRLLSDSIVCMSYRVDVVAIARAVADTTKAISVAEILRQYAELARRL